MLSVTFTDGIKHMRTDEGSIHRTTCYFKIQQASGG